MALHSFGGLGMILKAPSPSSRASYAAGLSFSRSEAIAGASSPKFVTQQPPFSITVSSSVSPPFEVYCGRGDKKTAKGKRFNHSFGNARPRNKRKGRGPPRIPAPPSPPKKDRFDDGEIVKIEIDETLFS